MNSFLRLTPPLLFVGLTALGLATPVIGNDNASARERLDEFVADFTSFTARFEQRLFDEYGELLETSNGRVALAKPGRFRWEYQAPYEQVIISNGTDLWVYDVDLEQVSINPVSDQGANSPAALLLGDVDLDAHYSIVEGPREEGVAWLKLMPRRATSAYQRVDIGFMGERLHGMRLQDNLRQLTEIKFDEVARNVDVGRDEFEFSPPAGVDILRNTPRTEPDG